MVTFFSIVSCLRSTSEPHRFSATLFPISKTNSTWKWFCCPDLLNQNPANLPKYNTAVNITLHTYDSLVHLHWKCIHIWMNMMHNNMCIKACIHACTYIHVLYRITPSYLKLELTGSIIHQKMSRQVSRRTNCKSRTRISPRRPSHHQHQTHHFNSQLTTTQGLDSITKRHFTMMRRRRRGMRMMLINN